MATFTVTTLDDETAATGNLVTETADGNGLSLREAIRIAQTSAGADTITFDAGLAGGTLALTNSNLIINGHKLTIDGDINGDDAPDITIDAQGASEAIHSLVIGGGTILNGLIITGGNNNNGGGVQSQGIMTISNSWIHGNTAGNGGGVHHIGSLLTVVNSTISGNTATSRDGGGIRTSGATSIINSTISGNQAKEQGGGIYTTKNLSVTNSTITGNEANFNGGLSFFGGGIYIRIADLTVTNSIIAGNDDNIGVGDNIHTLGGTQTYLGVNVFNEGGLGDAQDINANLGNIFANVSNDPNTGVSSGTLADNGGGLPTVAIVRGGVAEDAGDDAALADDTQDIDGDGNTTEDIPTDGRGINFVRVINGQSDVGAFEAGQLVVTTLDDETAASTDLATELADGNGLSLREALAIANSDTAADTITFDAALAGGTLTLINGHLKITESTTINGDTNGDLAADITISGNNAVRVFLINGYNSSGGQYSINTSLQSLDIADARRNSNLGGAIYADYGASLTIEHSTIRDSQAHNGGGIYVSNGVLQTEIISSTITGNHATTILGPYGGGGLSLNGSAILTNTTVSGNTANGSGAGIRATRNLTLNNSTVTDNRADADGNGSGTGGGIRIHNGTITLNNSVIAGNLKGTGPGTESDITVRASGTGTLIAENSFFGGTITLDTDNGGNIGVATSGDNPDIAALADNGGPVQTHAPQIGSALVNAGSNALVPAGVTTDASGDLRIQATTVDIGADEAPTQAPVFEAALADNTETIAIDENTAAATAIIDADANDGDEGATDANVAYSITAGNVSTDGDSDLPFAIDPDTGEITINDAGDLDFENAINSFVLTVQADDGGSVNGTTTATVNINLNNIGGSTLTGTPNMDVLPATNEEDIIDGLGDIDTIDFSAAITGVTVNLNTTTIQNTGGSGFDTISNIENLSGSSSADRFIGTTGASSGDNVLSGKGGADQLFGIGGDDTLNGGGGNDFALGGAGVDQLNGNNGDDILKGGDGNDTLTGGVGRDLLFGQAGADTFVFNDVAETGLVYIDRDIIRDFSQAEGDKIDLSGIDAVTGGSDDSFTFLGTLPAPTFTNTAGELLAVNTAGGQTVVWGDVDGDGDRDFSFVLDGALALTAGDFIL